MRVHAAAGVLAGLGVAPYALAQQCPPIPLQPLDAEARFDQWALADDLGTGSPRLYVAGSAAHLGVMHTGGPIFRGEGGRWVPVTGGPPDWSRPLLCAQREDGREALYTAHDEDHQVMFRRYDGATWAAMPPLPSAIGAVRSLVSFDPDGEGPQPAALHVLRMRAEIGPMGEMPQYGLVYAWNGEWWESVGPPTVTGALLVFRPGAGPHAGHPLLILSGASSHLSIAGVFRLDGAQWVSILPSAIESMTVHDPDGPGPAPPLLCGLGSFTTPAGHATRIGAWDGASWTGMAPGLSDITSIASFDPDGPGAAAPLLVAGGRFQRASGAPADTLAAWDGTQWSEFGGGAQLSPEAQPISSATVRAVPDHGPASAPSLHVTVVGLVHIAGRIPGPARWRAGAWQGLLDGPTDPVHALVTFDEGAGPRLFAAGRFRRCGDLAVNLVARWDGQQWSPLGSGIDPAGAQPTARVLAATVHDDGSGPKLYVAGTFPAAGPLSLRNIARWNGAAWERVGSFGLSGGFVHALAPHDPDGPGPLPTRLYAGGAFTFADGQPVDRLACWTGSAWVAVPGLTQQTGAVRALLSFNDGSGPALWVGGEAMSAGGLPPNLVFKLAASGWQSVPFLGSEGAVHGLALHDIGGGVKIYALGKHHRGVSARLVGDAWVEGPVTQPGDIAYVGRSVDDGHGPALFVGATYLGVARYTGATTVPLSPAFNGARAISGVFDDGRGPSIFFAGDFRGLWTHRGAVAAGHLVRLPVCAACYPNCDNSTAPPVLNVVDFSCFLQRYAAGSPWANCDGSTLHPILNVADFSCFLQRFAAGCP